MREALCFHGAVSYVNRHIIAISYLQKYFQETFHKFGGSHVVNLREGKIMIAVEHLVDTCTSEHRIPLLLYFSKVFPDAQDKFLIRFLCLFAMPPPI